MKMNKHDFKKLDELKSYPSISKQLEEVEELYPVIYEAVLKYVSLLDSYEEVLADDGLYDESYDTLFMDVNFYSVIDYIEELTVDNISELFGYFGGGGIYIDKEGRGAVVIQG